MAKKSRTVVFVCTGNFYRSRFCGYYFNALAERRGLRWRATSRGLRTSLADGQGPISHYALERLAACGIHVGEDVRFPVQLAAADLKHADLIVAMKEAEHRPMMEEQFPQWANRIQYWHIDDLDCAPPDGTLSHCQFHVEELVEQLAAMEPKSTRRQRQPLRKTP